MRTISTSITPWECSGEPPQWKAHPSVENYGEHCIICGRPSPGLRLPHRAKHRTPRSTHLLSLCLVLLALSAGWWLWQRGQQGHPSRLGAATQLTDETIAADAAERYSRGERRLLRYQSNRAGDFAAAAFATGDYQVAIREYEQAMRGDRRDPEVEIYRNNAQAHLAGDPLTIAAVVPIDSTASSAEEMLRGIADAQTAFNQAGGVSGRLLEVVIANDGNDPKISTGVARKLARQDEVLAVIGPNASAASEAAVSEYEKANMAMIGPTSGSTFISSRVFFRTTASNEALGKRLVDYARSRLNLKQVAVFYNPNDAFSRSAQAVFVREFRNRNGEFVQAIDMSNPGFDAEQQIRSLQGEFDAIVLFPDTQFLTTGLSLATANADLPPSQRMKLLGSTTLYRPQTLTSGGDAVEGMVLVVPWLAQTPYARQAAKRWGGQVSWRTAMSFDAAQALIQALSPNATRSAVLESLRSVRLAASQTSGYPLQFSPSGERLSPPALVQVVRGNGGPSGSSLTFQPLE